jgi:ADP-heptose:LPS heptosyltransferase
MAPARIRHPRPRRILVIKLGALGDFVQAIGPMRAIRNFHGDAHITLLTTPPFESLGRDCGLFDDIIAVPRPGRFDLPAWVALRARLLRGGFARVYDLQNNDRTAIYMRLFPRRIRPDWVGTAHGATFRNTSPERTAGSAFTGHAQTLALAGVTGVMVDDLSWMGGNTAHFGARAPYVLLIPGASPGRDEKRWPAAHYAVLAQHLANDGLQPVIIGAPEERAAAQTILAATPSALNLTGRTAIADIPALARGAIAAIGNDTGPMHLIGPTGCPSLVLFSAASNPDRHAPLGPRVLTIQAADIADIAPDTVHHKLHEMIG